MDKRIANTLGILASVALILAIWGCFGLCRSFIVAADGIAQTAKESQETLSKLPQSIKMLDEDLGALKSTIVHADLVARHEQQQLKTYDEYAAKASNDLSHVSQSASGAFDALAGTANQGTHTLSEVSTAIQPVAPLLVSFRTFTDDLDTSLKDKAMVQFKENLVAMTSNGVGITGDFHRVTTFYADDITKPKTWKQKVESRFGLGLDIVGFAARHF